MGTDDEEIYERFLVATAAIRKHLEVRAGLERGELPGMTLKEIWMSGYVCGQLNALLDQLVLGADEDVT